ncbi:isopentenyl diphosphate isomerase/L-lactate dehydrogenase-like FMN-dependent dehydrogenase [Virgibacillus litoralis]|uniref:Isopentenyl diphosphate isomerase/L-lactate dehydrogenase-like FMN-dependent dehydrogenase n=1 Tax=Virgibacillus litoralis TaxID=578221 RepID=A0ABS4HFF3_9BACI|nr:isopentenyl diphosphate isomerase/L-lactate dehydrogenase-like FMN-dependent dehydrogenase [Virgibacillus litoralis]
MSNFGNQVQFNVYQTMTSPDSERLPVVYEDWEKKAREVLEDGPYYYVAGGAGGGKTMKSNLRAFDRWNIVPRMLRNVEDRDLSVNLFGHTYNFPLLHAPIGVQSIIHEEGDLGSAEPALR